MPEAAPFERVIVLALDSVTERVKLKPYDEVIVRRNPTFHLQRDVKINGMVKYPGVYPILSDGERLSSFIERAGGLVGNANPDGAMLYRLKDTTLGMLGPLSGGTKTQYIKDKDGNVIDSIQFDPTQSVSIDLKKALDDQNSKYDMTLRQGDIIYIPETNPIVTVSGAVQSQVKIFYDPAHSNLGFYIDKAGGLGIRPWRKRIYVTYANGRSRRTHNFGFLHFYPKVEPGSQVVVPQRPEGKNVGDFFVQTLVTSVPILMAFVISKL